MLSAPATPGDMNPVEFRGRPFSERYFFRWGKESLVGIGYLTGLKGGARGGHPRWCQLADEDSDILRTNFAVGADTGS